MFVENLSVMIAWWLAMTCVIEMIQGNVAFRPLPLTGLILGCGLAAIFKTVPVKYRHVATLALGEADAKSRLSAVAPPADHPLALP